MTPPSLTFHEGSDADLKRDGVYEQILLDIICGELRPGAQIDEVTLADAYAAGRAGVRDALYRLALEGLIDRRPRLGSFVAAPGFVELQQVFRLRIQLEGQCATLAAQNARPADIAALKNAYRDAERAIQDQDWRAIIRFDRAFHGALATAAQNRWLAHCILTLHNSALRFWHYALPRRPADAVRKEVDLHLKVADAVAARDPLAAETAMRTVLGEFPSTVKELFAEDLPHAAGAGR
ncbi:GntR family transcriptional regulator [Aquabacter spiritensis]|uniref:GntR family transcriptional regulator n=1 Tax=Aquabacter spiritensis TaxID=933073 RepID=A0A4R3LW76_9HYPH|nr:GntR family transcriptional regulator [Aquabacter spiritensis]TCT04386.1 GntR family transcriptional regulator [Aquabacter spiritensis]